MIHPYDKTQMRHAFWTAVFSDYSASGMSMAEYCRSRLAEFIASSHYAGLFSRTPSYITFLKRINSIRCSITCATAEAVVEAVAPEPVEAAVAEAVVEVADSEPVEAAVAEAVVEVADSEPVEAVIAEAVVEVSDSEPVEAAVAEAVVEVADSEPVEAAVAEAAVEVADSEPVEAVVAEAVVEAAAPELDNAVAADSWADATASLSAVNGSNEAEAPGHLSYCLNSPDCQIAGKSATVTAESVTGSVFSIHKKPEDAPGPCSFQGMWRRSASLITTTTSPSSLSLSDKAQQIAALIHGPGRSAVVSFDSNVDSPILPLIPGEVIADRMPPNGMSRFPESVGASVGMIFPLKAYELKGSAPPRRPSSSHNAYMSDQEFRSNSGSEGSLTKPCSASAIRQNPVIDQSGLYPGIHDSGLCSGSFPLNNEAQAPGSVRVFTAAQLPPAVLAMMSAGGSADGTAMPVSVDF